MKSTHFLKALSLSVAALALNAGTAHASTVGIYGGGSTLAYLIYDTMGQCVGVQNSGSNPDTAKATALGCTTPLNSAYEYLFTATGSGAGLAALVANTATTSATKSGTVAIDAGNGFGAYPYPSWQLTFSDAPLETLDNIGSTTTYLADYITALKTKRGQAWQVPVSAVPVGLPFNLPSATFGTTFYGAAVSSVTVSNSATVSATVPKLDLSTDMVCYIWTQKDHKGNAVSGTYTWDNPIFYGAKSSAKTPKITNYDSNLVASSVTGLAIQPVKRSDASGTTYLFTLWLSKNCKGYTTAGYSTPATLVTFPSFITLTGNGGGALVGTVQANNGAIGYSTPDALLPAKSTGAPAAFLAAGKSKVTDAAPTFLYPTPANTVLAETGVTVPTKITAKAWGTSLTKKFFKAATVNTGYAITGLTYAMGYTCYVNDSAKDEYTGVKSFVNFLSDAKTSTLLTNNGFAPLTAANYTSEVGTVVANLTGVSATPVVSGKKTITGPKACKLFTTDAHDYQ